jgi:hypothetical protein
MLSKKQNNFFSRIFTPLGHKENVAIEISPLEKTKIIILNFQPREITKKRQH